jgi:hypothetical protein
MEKKRLIKEMQKRSNNLSMHQVRSILLGHIQGTFREHSGNA